MANRRWEITSLTALVLVAAIAAPATQAGDRLSSAEIKELITDKTVSATHLKKNFDFRIYFSGDGTAVRLKDGSVKESPYEITTDNEHCVTSVIRNKRKCAYIEANGDGTYDRVLSNGKHVIRWSEFEAGRTF